MVVAGETPRADVVLALQLLADRFHENQHMGPQTAGPPHALRGEVKLQSNSDPRATSSIGTLLPACSQPDAWARLDRVGQLPNKQRFMRRGRRPNAGIFKVSASSP